MFSRSFVAALVLAPFIARTAFAACCSRTYTVQDGDYCDAISAANNVSTHQLSVVNPGIDPVCHNLAAGQVLCLGTANTDCQSTHIVQSGETCEGLTNTYGINSTMLYANNPQLDAECSNLYTGEVICVADAVYAAAAPADCSESATLVLSTIAPSTSHIAVTSTPVTTKPTAAVVTTTESKPTTAAAAPDDGDDEDDGNVPFCDEL